MAGSPQHERGVAKRSFAALAADASGETVDASRDTDLAVESHARHMADAGSKIA
jgi:hypothetical protein